VKHSDKVAPLAAVVSAVSCMACCLPIGFAAAAGTAGFAFALGRFRPWLMILSVGLLVFGVWQLYWRPRVCRTRSRTTLAIFWTCAAVVLTLIVAPQLVAGWLADL
jgi:hypothetical protein